MREKVITPEVAKVVISMRVAGYSYNWIAHHTGLFGSQVYQIINYAGLIGKSKTLHRKRAGEDFPDAEPMVG